MTNSCFWNNFNKASRKTIYQSRLQRLLWDGSQLEKWFHTKEYQTHSCIGRVKIHTVQNFPDEILYDRITLHLFQGYWAFEKKRNKNQYMYTTISLNVKLHALKRKREKNNEVDFQWAKGGLQIVTGWEFASVRVIYHV